MGSNGQLNNTAAAHKRTEAVRPLKFGSFDIVYRNPKTLEMGDVVHGWVEITLNRTVLLHRMTVNFYGEISYHNSDGSLKAEKIERRTQDLWREPKNSKNGAKLDAGFYQYEFYVGTGKNLPGSFVSKSGIIRTLIYYCEATIVERDPEDRNVDHIKRKPLILHSAPSERLTSLSSDYLVAERGVTYVRNFLDMSGCVAATAVLSKKLYKPGENLYFNVEILNCFRQLSVYVSLTQKAKVAQEGSSIFTPVTHELYRKKLGTLKSSEPYKQYLGKSLWIPDWEILPVNIQKFYKEKRIVYLGTNFVITVKPLMGNSLRVELPIVVRNSKSGKVSKLNNHSGASTV